jgi:hypothetical protein
MAMPWDKRFGVDFCRHCLKYKITQATFGS